MKIQENSFTGIMPKLANDKLPEAMGQVVQDAKTTSGELVAYMRSLGDLELAESSYKTFFEYIFSSTNNWVYYDGVVFWARSMVPDDTFERMYIMGESGLPSRGTLTVDTIPTATDTMTIDTTVYTFVAVGAGANPLDIEVGADLPTAQANIKAAIEGTDGWNATHSTVTIGDWLNNDVVLTAISHGTAGDSIVTTETFTAGTNVFDAATLGTTQAGADDGLYKAFANDINSSPWDFTADFYLPGSDIGSAPTIQGYTGGGSEIRAYYYSYVSRYSEEGPGSAITTIEDYTSGRVQVDDIDFPDAADDHLITAVGSNRPSVRVYRTDSTLTSSSYFLVCEAEWFDATHTYVAGEFVFYDDGGGYDLYECTVGGVGSWVGGTHTFVQGELVAASSLTTTSDKYLWSRAEDDLTNLRSHPNGFLVASKDNELHFCEPFAPWAWPEDYKITIDSQIVGVGIFGSTIVVATDASIYTFAGPHPTSLYKTRLSFQPCLSQRGLVETDSGVVFPSKEGFQLVNSSGVNNITADLFDPEDWDNYELDTIHGTYFNKSYYGFFKSADYEGQIRLDLLNGAITTGTKYHYAGYVALQDGEFRTITDSNLDDPGTLYIARWDADGTSYRNFNFRSRRYILEKPANFKVCQIILDSDFYQEVLDTIEEDSTLADLNQAQWDLASFDEDGDTVPDGTDWGAGDLEGPMNGFMLNAQDVNGDTLFNIGSLGVQNYIQFELWANSVLKFTKEVQSSNMFKLPRGFRAKKWEFRVSGMIPIKRVTIATSTEEIV